MKTITVINIGGFQISFYKKPRPVNEKLVQQEQINRARKIMIETFEK